MIYEGLLLKHYYVFLKTLLLQKISNGCFWQFQISSLALLKKDLGKDVYLGILQNF